MLHKNFNEKNVSFFPNTQHKYRILLGNLNFDLANHILHGLNSHLVVVIVVVAKFKNLLRHVQICNFDNFGNFVNMLAFLANLHQ